MEYSNLIDLIATVSNSNLKDFHYEDGDTKVIMSSTKQEEKKEEGEEIKVATTTATTGKVVKSPLVGMFYLTPSEEAAPFVNVGDRVKKGQVLAIVEAMKLMNEIESEYDGEVVEVCVESGTMVEYGQPLFKIS